MQGSPHLLQSCKLLSNFLLFSWYKYIASLNHVVMCYKQLNTTVINPSLSYCLQVLKLVRAGFVTFFLIRVDILWSFFFLLVD